jgi:hypothetical protein
MALTSALLAALAQVSLGLNSNDPVRDETWAPATEVASDLFGSDPPGTLLN